MPAILMVQGTILDKERYAAYVAAVRPLIGAHGGRPIANGSEREILEGPPTSERLVVFEFPSMAALKGFWESPEYVPVKAIRAGAADLRVWAIPT